MNSKNNNSDMIDMQDKMGYVDTGPTLQPPNNVPYQPPVATSTSAHLIIKEPKPQRQLHLPTEPPKKKPLNGYKPEPLVVTDPPPIRTPIRTTAEKRVTYEQTPRYTATTNREEIKEMMVHKLHELAEMLSSFDIDEPTYGPRPTPSKSDPQQQIKRRPSKGKIPSPENNRHIYNKSSEYNEPIYTHRPYYTYYDHPPPPQQRPIQQERIYDDDDYYQENEPYFQPQSSTYVPRPRRKSYGNMRDEQQHPRLVRKPSRNNLSRHVHTRQPLPPPSQVPYDPRYDSYQPPPPTNRYHPSYYQPYSPDEYY